MRLIIGQRIAPLAAALAPLLWSPYASCQDSGNARSLAEASATESSAEKRASKASTDVVELARRYLEACVTRDADYLAAHSIDDPTGSFSGINSGPGPGRGLPDTVAHFRELPPVKWSGLSPEGYVVGDFAWFTDYAKGVLPSGQELDIRVTLLMRRVGNDWKTVHYHVSEGLARQL